MKYLDLSYGQVSDAERPQLNRLLNVLYKKQKIVIIAGAGISASAGIPEFRFQQDFFALYARTTSSNALVRTCSTPLSTKMIRYVYVFVP
jgi:NAD-dependent SIR2 family protein deacetylase